MTDPEPATQARTRLSKERVLRTAVDLADRGGLEGLSMRKLADELGVKAMSLYYYVPNKDELITGMVDIVFGEIDLPPSGGDWRAAMRRRAQATRNALNRHRWAVGLMESRERPGPESFRVHNAVLGYLREAGFSIEMTIQAYSLLDAYIYGFALQETNIPFDDPDGAAAIAAQQAQEYEDAATARQLATFGDEFPHLAEVVAGHVASVGHDFDTAFEYGLELILDALEQRRTSA